MSKKNHMIESVLDLNCNNVWNVEEQQIASLWKEECDDVEFASSRQKVKNIIRLAFELETYKTDDPRDQARYDSQGYVTFLEGGVSKYSIAIRKRRIQRITDLSYENIRHIDAQLLMDLIDGNFGGGWDSIPLALRDIIESAFEISTTMLPTDRLHLAGGTRDRKLADGFDVLEIAKGNWTEAIFVKKKELVEKVHTNFDPDKEDEELGEEDDEEEVDVQDPSNDDEDDSEAEADDETFYGTFIPEAEQKDIESLDDINEEV